MYAPAAKFLKGGRMTCQRCQGLMVVSKLWDDVIAVDLIAHYCINCGEMVDRVILQNRQPTIFPASWATPPRTTKRG